MCKRDSAAGAKGKRHALANARIMIHQGSAGFRGSPSDIDIMAKEILLTKKILQDILSKHTGQPVEKVAEDTDRDYFMSGEEAKEYGIVDVVLDRGTR